MFVQVVLIQSELRKMGLGSVSQSLRLHFVRIHRFTKVLVNFCFDVDNVRLVTPLNFKCTLPTVRTEIAKFAGALVNGVFVVEFCGN
jgi:hypothetical protein